MRTGMDRTAWITAVDAFTGARRHHDPFNSDGPGPLLIAMLQFPTQQLEAGLADQRFKQSVAAPGPP